MRISKVCILGGTGFVGRRLAARLSADGLACLILSRHPHRHRELSLISGVEVEAPGSLSAEALEKAFGGCDAVINLVGILNETGPRNSFRVIHVDLVDTVVDACRAAGVHRLLHMSALQADASKGSSQYLRTKGEGENRAHTRGQSTIQVTSFRPSVIFGPGDGFFNRFAGLLRLSPGVFPLACPRARFAPVYVGDVADALAVSLGDETTFNKRYDLCGPRVFSLQELVEYTARMLGLRTRILGLGDGLSRLQARLLGLVPGKPFSLDNYLSLQTDSVCAENGLHALGLTPTDVDGVVPFYLGRAGQRARYLELRKTC